MNGISSYMQSAALQLSSTLSMAAVDMAINGSAEQMAKLIETIEQTAAPAVDGLGMNLDVRA